MQRPTLPTGGRAAITPAMREVKRPVFLIAAAIIAFGLLAIVTVFGR
ncbi:hypothetical protein [Hyphobacterium sp.]